MVTVSRARVRFLFALFAIASLVLSARVAYWQTVGRGDLLARATDQVRSDLVVAAQRGVIRDRAGAILATTVELRSLYAIPGQMKDRDGHDERPAVAAALAPILGEQPEVIRAALESGADWIYLRRRLPEDIATRVAALGIGTVDFRASASGSIGNGGATGSGSGSISTNSNAGSGSAELPGITECNTRCDEAELRGLAFPSRAWERGANSSGEHFAEDLAFAEKRHGAARCCPHRLRTQEMWRHHHLIAQNEVVDDGVVSVQLPTPRLGGGGPAHDGDVVSPFTQELEVIC